MSMHGITGVNTALQLVLSLATIGIIATPAFSRGDEAAKTLRWVSSYNFGKTSSASSGGEQSASTTSNCTCSRDDQATKPVRLATSCNCGKANCESCSSGKTALTSSNSLSASPPGNQATKPVPTATSCNCGKANCESCG